MELLTRILKREPSSSTKTKHPGLSFYRPIKYYDFHVYYFNHNKKSREEALTLRQKLFHDFPNYAEEGSIIVKIRRQEDVIGPHPTQFWEVDVRRPEVFLELLGWFQVHHGNLPVLIHPQTGNDVEDHSRLALWLGDRLPLFFDQLPESAGIPEFGVLGGQRRDPEEFDKN